MNAPTLAAPVTERANGQTPVPLFELDGWDRWGLRAGITGREGHFDLGLFADGRAGEVMDHWLSFEASQRPGFSAVAISRQVHGNRIRLYSEIPGSWHLGDGFDGHLTNCQGLLLAITVADCIPIYLAHPGSRTVALLHAGWRGLASGILETGIRHLMALSNGSAAELVMHCGVGICGSCYEVGPEVFHAVTGRSASSSVLLDLRSELAARAVGLGVRDVTVSTWCSSHDSERFFSHRRSGGADGRMVAYLGVPTERK